MARSTRPFLLASQSPRRLALLAQLGVSAQVLQLFEPHEAESAEALEAECPGEAPDTYVQRVTAAKWSVAKARLADRALQPVAVLCADTTVSFQGRILGKAQSPEQAAEFLQVLSGQVHQVSTAVLMAWPTADGQWAEAMRVQRSQVRFAPLDADQIARYVASGDYFGKAGAYGIQGPALPK